MFAYLKYLLDIHWMWDMNNTQLCWQMEIVPGMPHGFLAFGQMSTECQMGVDHVTKKIGELIRRLAE